MGRDGDEHEHARLERRFVKQRTSCFMGGCARGDFGQSLFFGSARVFALQIVLVPANFDVSASDFARHRRRAQRLPHLRLRVADDAARRVDFDVPLLAGKNGLV